VRGRAAIRESVAGYLAAFSDFHAKVGEPIVSGNRAAQEWKVTGTNDGELMGVAPTGKSATTYGCGTAEFGEDGLIHRGGNYWNVAALMQQLGVLPETAAAPA
jgi:predicted ester cyclase